MRLFQIALLLTCSLAAPLNIPRRQPPARQCARECVARDCGAFSIRYGKYCGITTTGCKGEEPCDAIDACCMQHDACVQGGGLSRQDAACHATFTTCLQAASGTPATFTRDPQCSAERVTRTMAEGITMAARLSEVFSNGGVKVDMDLGMGGGGERRGRSQ